MTRRDQQMSAYIDLLMRHAERSDGDPIYLDRLESILFRPGWRGAQGIWIVPEDNAAQVLNQLKETHVHR